MTPKNTGFRPESLRLIAAALALHQAERIATSITPLPGTDRFIAIGTPAEVARLMEIAPAAQEVTQQAAKAEAWMHEDGRVVAASTMEAARRDGGAMRSSLAGYTIRELYARPVHDAAAPSDVQRCKDCGRTGWHVCRYSAGAAAKTEQAFPERDQTKPAEQQGLFRKFDVRRVDGSDQPGGKHYGCRYYVLDLTHDQHAPAAMRSYAAACRSTHPQLADDIEAEFGAAGAGSAQSEQISTEARTTK